MAAHDETVEKVARAICISTGVGPDLKYADGQPAWTGYAKHASAAVAAMPPALSPELIDKLGKLAAYLTEQGEYEACDLIDTVVARLTPKAKG